MAESTNPATHSTCDNIANSANNTLLSQHHGEDLEIISSEPSPPLTPELDPVEPSQRVPDMNAEMNPPPWGIPIVQFNRANVIKSTEKRTLRGPFITKTDPDTPDANTSIKEAWLRATKTSYRYTKIDREQVRLLVIKRGARNDELHVILSTVPRKHLDKSFPYIALSYHWGDGNADKVIMVQTKPTSLGEQSVGDIALLLHTQKPKKLSIRPNLHAALKHLRRETQEVTVWVDALCINQNDTEEKSEQIRHMPSIYRRAYNVCIWLGTDEGSNSVSDIAMKFISEVIDPHKHDQLLNDDKMISHWASLFELLEWSWFSRRWIIQEVALARSATVHCGNNPEISWNDFQDAIATFCRDFIVLRPKLRSYFAAKYPTQGRWHDESDFEIEQLGAKLLVDITTDLFRDNENEEGALESTYSLETLVCLLSSFDTSNPRDTINALINISSEYHRNDPGSALAIPAPEYDKPLLQVYRQFVKWVVTTSKSLDIICRYWALPNRDHEPPLPSWIKSAKESAFGTGYGVFEGRKAGESLVGLPGTNCYHASGRGHQQRWPIVNWGMDVPPQNDVATQEIYAMSITVTGHAIGTVSSCTEPFPDNVITKPCLEGLGWSFKQDQTAVAEVPKQLWQTLVANRGPQGTAMPALYRRACQYVMVNLTRNGHIKLDTLLGRSLVTGYVKEYLERVRAVTWNRLFFEADGPPSSLDGLQPSETAARKLVGLGPPGTKHGDVIAILFGCSVPVILHPVHDAESGFKGYQLIGEAFVYGKMDGEAFHGEPEEVKFCLI